MFGHSLQRPPYHSNFPKAGLLNIQVAQQSVTNVISVTILNLVTPKVALA